MGRVLLKLYLILWKNFIIRKRHWLLTILEIVIPVLLGVLNLFLTSVIPKNYIANTTYYEVHDFKDPTSMDHTYLYYTPNNFTWIKNLMDGVDQQMGYAVKDFRKYRINDSYR